MLEAISYHPIVRIHLGPLSISPHGIGIAVGFLIGARLMVPAAERRGITAEQVYALLTRAAIGAVIGARLAYVANHLSDYGSILDALKVWKGGISLLGGIFGAIVLALPKMRSEGLSFWKVMDAAAPGIALGIIIGRVGDLIVADHLGKTTGFFLGYKCPTVQTASPCIPGTVVHQTALYDFFDTIVLLGVLLRLRRRPLVSSARGSASLSRSRSDRYDGFLIIVFGAWYGAMRVVEDFLREDVRHFGLTGSQWTALATVAVCLWALFFLRRTPKWGRWDEEDVTADAGSAGGASPAAGKERETAEGDPALAGRPERLTSSAERSEASEAEKEETE